MPSMRREKVYTLLDELQEGVAALGGDAWSRGNLDDASWLASAEDAIARFIEDFDDHVDAESERRWDKMQEAALEYGDNEGQRLAHMAEMSRRLK